VNDPPWWDAFFRGPWEQIQLAGYPEERTRAEVTFIVEALQLEGPAQILDIPCGEGRHAIGLARRGFQVTGVDFNENAIAAALRRAAEAEVEVDFRTGDMRRLEAEGEYDAAVCFFGSFGYFSDEENLEFLHRVARALRPGGRFLLDGHVTESLYPKFRERDWSWVREEPPLRLLEDRRMDFEVGRVQSTWTFVSDTGTESRRVSIRVYSYRELTGLLRMAGFSAFAALETGTKKPFRLGASRLAVVATKTS
jgi:SAM-dependent methyltransferase